MTERTRRLYRAVITAAPDGPVPRQIIRGGWWNEEIVYLAQDHAEVEVDPWDMLDDYDRKAGPYWVEFHAGQSRTFHAKANAERRARLWRAHGCTVRVDTSDPISWHQGKPA